jgi:hypothetical protein
MPGHFSHDIITALTGAAVKVFWTKADLRRMLNIAGVDQELINQQDWNQYKFLILSPIIDALNNDQNGLGSLRRILYETLRYKKCDHLLRYRDGKKLKKEAEESLESLRELVTDHDSAKASEEEEREARRRRLQEAQKGRAFQEVLSQLKERYFSLLSKQDENERGYDLEKLLNETFALFELEPQSPFRRVGEQIDGGFVLNKEHFLLEAKWQKKHSNLNDLRDLDGAVNSSLDNTLGLFVSVSGFSAEGIAGYIEGHRPRIICMDGSDLMLVYEGRVDLPHLLLRKKDIAVQKRRILVSANDIIVGRY